MIRLPKTPNPPLDLLHLHIPSLTTASFSPAPSPPASNPIAPINEAHLLRVCTVLYQQQGAPNIKLHASLTKTRFNLNHEFFLQVCNKFPCSWRPVYRFHLFAISQPNFAHTPTTFNKILDAVGKSRNIDLFWQLCREIAQLRLVNAKTYVIALRSLAAARELKKCVEFFHLMNGFGYVYRVETFNMVVEFLCRNKLVAEANHVVSKLKGSIKPDATTYRWLIHGFCDAGSLIEASQMWNLMVDEGFGPNIRSTELMLETLFKKNQLAEGLKLFSRMECVGLSTYKLVIKWLCKKAQMGEAHFVFDEMRRRGIKPDNDILGSIVYGLLKRGRANEAYKIFKDAENRDMPVYHGMIKGLVELKRASEATQIFREMIRLGCEPTMHTYIMLLQGHLGKRGRRGGDPLVDFDTIFVGGLVKAGEPLDACKYVERVIDRGVEVPRFDYNKFLHCFSNEEGAAMFESVALKLREVGLFDLGDIFERYGLKMTTRDRRRRSRVEELGEGS